jgi:hypothetical protein
MANKQKAIEVLVHAEKKDAELQNIIAEQKLGTQRILGELITDGQRKEIIAIKGNGTPKEISVPKRTLIQKPFPLNRYHSQTIIKLSSHSINSRSRL